MDITNTPYTTENRELLLRHTAVTAIISGTGRFRQLYELEID